MRWRRLEGFWVVAATPLVFRPSPAQRALAGMLCVGSWLVGVRALALLIQYFPRWLALLRYAQAQGEPTFLKWTLLVAAVLACVVGGVALLLSVIAFVLIEGCQVLVDDLGLAVEYSTLPAPLARRFGAGRLAWRQVLSVEKRLGTFVVMGSTLVTDPVVAAGMKPTIRLRFIMVEELERLIIVIMERSPHLS
jgi:hypothetical protein